MREIPFVSALVETYQEAKQMEQVSKIEMRKVTFLMDPKNHGLLEAISDFYGRTKTAVLNDILEEALREFFEASPKDVRLDLGRRADRIWLNDLKQSHKDAGGEYGVEGLKYWEVLADPEAVLQASQAASQ